jgi:drug/metabolite transporter (DMT)-like permease
VGIFFSMEKMRVGLSYPGAASGRPMAKRGTLLAVGTVVLFGYFAVVAADLLEHHTSLELAFRNSLIAGVVLGIGAARRGSLRPDGHLGALVAIGFCIAVMSVLFFTALDRLGAGPAITLQFVTVLMVMVWTKVVRGMRVPVVAWAAGLVTMLGISLVVEAWVWETVDLVGIASGVAAAVFLAAYLLIVDYLGGRLRPFTISAYAMAIATLLVLPFSGIGPMDLPVSDWWWLLALGALGTAAPVVLEVAAVRYAGPGPVGIVILTQPVVGAIAAWLLLGQILSPGQMVGIGVSLAGVVLVQMKVTEALA